MTPVLTPDQRAFISATHEPIAREDEVLESA